MDQPVEGWMGYAVMLGAFVLLAVMVIAMESCDWTEDDKEDFEDYA